MQWLILELLQFAVDSNNLNSQQNNKEYVNVITLSKF